MLEGLFAAVVLIVWPIRALRRSRHGAQPSPAVRYIVETLLLTAALGALLWRNGIPLAALGLTSDPLHLLRNLAICLAVILGADAWSTWRITRRIQRASPQEMPQGVFADALTGRRHPVAFTIVASVGAVWEELCFRATVFALVPHTWIGLLAGVVGGSVAFGLQHLRNGTAGFTYALFYGVLFSVLYLVTGDLIAVIIAHAAGNILAALQWAPRIERARREALMRQSPIFIA